VGDEMTFAAIFEYERSESRSLDVRASLD
jgi:hypothetical protein